MDQLPYELATAVVAHAKPSIGVAVALSGHIARGHVAVTWAHSLLASGDYTFRPPPHRRSTRRGPSRSLFPPTTSYMRRLVDRLRGGNGLLGGPLRHVFQLALVLDYLLLSTHRFAAVGDLLDHLVSEGRKGSAPGPTSALYYLHYGDYSPASYYPPAPSPPPTALMGTYSDCDADSGYGTPPKSVVAQLHPEAHRLQRKESEYLQPNSSRMRNLLKEKKKMVDSSKSLTRSQIKTRIPTTKRMQLRAGQSATDEVDRYFWGGDAAINGDRRPRTQKSSSSRSWHRLRFRPRLVFRSSRPPISPISPIALTGGQWERCSANQQLRRKLTRQYWRSLQRTSGPFKSCINFLNVGKYLPQCLLASLVSSTISEATSGATS
ncbi:hypothetical protein BC828DRAFT_188494 [Blastocladiella britannica]|nr:hypothetical protein BC828DRAFT_188494 [Blastocladiella britannica]